MLETLGDRRARCALRRFRLARFACAATMLFSAPLAAIPTLTTAVAEPGPAMWVISDEDTTIFLFGTFHALDQDTGWFSNAVRAAFEKSDELVLETVVPSDPAELLASLDRHSLAAQPKAGEPVVSGAASGSFAAVSAKAISAGRSIGMSVDNGADAVLRRAALQSSKHVNGLESFDFQLAMFSSLPAPSSTSGASEQVPPQSGQLAAVMTDMKAAWKRGDASRFATVLGSVEQQSPETYRRLFADRNARWAGWVAKRMERPGVVFVAVGTGHLIGRDSVQRRLNELGFDAIRIS